MAVSKLLQGYRDAYTGHSHEIWVLAVFSFINRVGTMVVPFLTVYITTVLHYPLKQAGFIAGMFGLGSLAGAFVGGRLTDRFGGRRVILFSLLSSGILLILLQFALSFEALAAGVFFTALCGDAYRPAIMTLTGEFSGGQGTGRSMALIRLAINLGFSAAPALGGLVVASFGYPWLFWIDGITCLAAAGYLTYASRTWTSSHHATTREEKQAERSLIAPPWRNPRFLIFLVATFLTGFGFMQWFHSVPVFLKTTWFLDERYIGPIMGLNGLLIVLVEMPLVHALERTGRAKAAMLTGLVFIGLSFLPFLLPGSLWLAFGAMLLMTIGEILFQPFNSSLALKLAPAARRGEYMAWYSMGWGVAHITAPTVGLAAVEAFGFPVFWVCVAVLVGLSMLVNMRFDPNKEG